MRTLRLAPVLLLALVACQVDTNSLKPKTDADCWAADPYSKACGPKCVRLDDPATGCGTLGDCAACPAGGAHTVPYCLGLTTSFCDVECEYGWDDCNFDRYLPGSNGCELNVLQNDAFNCGACANRCASSECIAGACKGAAVTGVWPIRPIGIRNVNSAIYYLDPDVDGGSLWELEKNAEIAIGLGFTKWMTSLYGYNSVLASGTIADVTTPYGYQLVIYDIANLTAPPAAPASLWTGYFSPAAFLGENIEGVGINPGGLSGSAFFFSTNALNSGLYGWEGGFMYDTSLTSVSGVLGFATYETGGRTFYGVSSSGGEIRWIDVRGAAGSYSHGTLASATGTPARLALFENSYYAPVPRLFWISDLDGSVRSTTIDGYGAIVTHVPPQPYAPGGVDITADSNGVYFTNVSNHTVQMWRPWDDRVIDLGYSFGPLGIAVRYPQVWWTDPDSSAIYTVAVP